MNSCAFLYFTDITTDHSGILFDIILGCCFILGMMKVLTIVMTSMVQRRWVESGETVQVDTESLTLFLLVFFSLIHSSYVYLEIDSLQCLSAYSY